MIYNSSFHLNKSKNQNEIGSLNFRKIKIFSLQKPKPIMNKNYRYLKLSNKFRNSRMLSENDLLKTKLKTTNNFTNYNDTFNSLLKSDFSSSEIIIKKAREFHNNASKETDFTKKDETTFLTENNNSPKFLQKINFNSSLNDYLRKNVFTTRLNKNIYDFMEKNRIQRRMYFLTNLCKHLVKTFKKNDYFEKFQKKVAKSELIYKNFKYRIDKYLSFLEVIKFQDEQLNYNLKKKKVELMKDVRILNKKVDKYKIISNKVFNIKIFLKEFREKIEEISSEKNSNMNSVISSNTKPHLNSSDFIKSSPSLRNTKNINDLKLHLFTINKKKNISNFFNINISNKTPKNRRNKNFNLNNIDIGTKSKFNNNISKSILTFDNSKNIYSNPDEFINAFEKKINKIRNDLDNYNMVMKDINDIKNENFFIYKSSKIDKIEKKLKEILNSLKKENIILKKKFEKIKKIKMKPEFNLITEIAKKMILNINLYYNLKTKFNIDFNPNFEKFEPKDYEQKDEKKIINKNIYLLKILERIFDILIEQDKKYKQNPKYIKKYKIIKIENEHIKFEMRRKRKRNNILLIKEELEKNRKIVERQEKMRYFPMKTNGFCNLNFFNRPAHFFSSSSSKKHLVDKKILAKRREINDLLYYN